ncbi:hypothetical protein TH25_12330 [Thalassospira profundimaris]|uniref:OmpA-like domain-containing protein n=1 Tax=Thalassospira profundimaris TaxID=502049 RepID=A0A367X9U9_9PROT|nr:OmpA family protein [Thalassospira profundimaris]RCK50367.1 hypothetical protein TH25_12330 [Thalassospira profundimaris]
MTGNTKISAIAIAAALGTLMATSQGATAASFSPVMPGNNVQVDLGVLDRLDTRDAPATGFLSSQNNTQRIEIDRQLVIYPRTAPKSRFLAPQLLLTPPSDPSRIDTSGSDSYTSSGADFGTVVIDGAGIVPSENATPQRAPFHLNPPQNQERIHLRPPASYPARPAVERLETPPASQPFFSRGNLGGSLNRQDLDDDGAPQIIHLVAPKAHNVDGLPRNRPAQATPAATATQGNVTAAQNRQAAPQQAATTAPAKGGPLLAENDVKPSVPAPPKVAKPDSKTPNETPKNKIPAPEVKKAPLPKADKPAPAQPAPDKATAPQPLTKDNAVKPAPAPAPDTTTPPQKMPDQQSGTLPKPPASKKAAHNNDPAPEPRVKPQIPARETASVPTADPASAPAKKSGPAPAGGDYSLPFAADSFELDASAKKSLDKVIGNLAQNGDLRVQLQAYAAGESQNASKARRLSLSRALQVRSYLIDGGVRSTRIDVRALGANVPSGPADRVDIKTVQR